MDGKALTPEKNKTQTVELGNKQLQPDLEKAILGMKKGEETSVKIKLDEKIEDKKYAGKETEFKVKLNEIRYKEIPTVHLSSRSDTSGIRLVPS